MVSRDHLPYIGVIGLGGLFISFGIFGLVTLAGDPGIGPAFTRIVLMIFLLLGISAVLVASIDLYRHSPGEK